MHKTLCACGCGTPVASGRSYVNHHNIRQYKHFVINKDIQGDKNPMRRPEVVAKFKQTRQNGLTKIRAGKTYEQIYGTQKAEEIKCKLRVSNPAHSERMKSLWQTPEYREHACARKSENSRAMWQNPEYRKKMKKFLEKGYRTSHKGYFWSDKNDCDIYYESSYELQAFMLLEKDSSVLQYGRCTFQIPYIYKGVAHLYRPDIYVEYKDAHHVLEIKSQWEMKHPEKSGIIFTKKIAAEEYCHQIGATYKIWTEAELCIIR